MKLEAKAYYKQLLIAGGIIATMTLVLVLVSSIPKSTEPMQLDARGQSLQKLEKADEDMIAAALDVYYANAGEYPTDVQSVIQFQEDQNKDIVQGGIDRMTNRHMVYIVRSDKESYSFNYKSVDSQTVSREGNYREMYH